MSTPRTAPSRSIRSTRVEMDSANPLAEEQALARKVFEANKAMNAAKRVHEKCREDLANAMRKKGITEFTSEASDDDGKLVKLSATLTTPDRESIDIKLLKKKVDDKTFLACVSATKAAVVDHAGKTVLAQCIIVTPGNETVTVKAIK